MNTTIVSDIDLGVKGLRATPMTAARRARELADIHNAVCRARRQGLVCSTCTDLNGRAARLEDLEIRRTRNFRLIGCPHETSCDACYQCQALIDQEAGSNVAR